MNYSRGEIIWVKFPFSDSASTKLRPALIISNNLINRSGDYLLMQITTRLRKDELSQLINESDYIGPPLLKQSELRLHKIFILNETLIAGGITNISPVFMNGIINKLVKLIE